MSFFKFPKWALSLIHTQLANCLWDDTEGNHKIHLANLPSVCMKKMFGGLGIPNLQDMNLCMLGSWIKRYIQGKGSLWRKVVDSKYNTRNPNILCCQDTHPSTFWKGVMWAAKSVKMGYRWKVGNGRSVKFWEDIWFGNAPLSTQFWDIHIVSNQQTRTIAELWYGTQLCCDFRRTFSEEMLMLWHQVVDIAKTLVLSLEEDQLIWQYESKGVYSSKSMYAIVNFRGVKQVYLPAVWDIKVPPRIQMFFFVVLLE